MTRILAALLFMLPGLAMAQGSAVLCARQPGYIGCLPSATSVLRTHTLPLAAGDTARRVSIADILGRMQASDVVAALETITGVVNVKSYGALCDGVTDDAVALNLASARAAQAGRVLYVPAGGACRIVTSNPLVLYPGVPLRGDGIGRSTLLCDDTGAGAQDCISNVSQAGSYDISDLTLRGMAQTVPTSGRHTLFLNAPGAVRLTRVESRYSRGFAFVVIGGTSLVADGVSVYRSNGDGVVAWDTPDVQVVNSRFVGTNDDAISAHTNDTAAAPPRARVLIANNTFTESQGFSVLGAKQLTVTGNTMSRMMAYCGYIGAVPFFNQGSTPLFAVTITGNTCTDVFRRPEATPRNTEQAYLILNLSSRQAGTGAAAPGDPAPTTGAVVPLIGAGGGTFYTQTQTAALPGNYWVDISHNTFARTLPSSLSWSGWGVGSSLWVGEQQSGGLYSGGVPETNLQTEGIQITGTMRQSRIGFNFIRTTGTNGIRITGATTVRDGDYDGLDIVGNDISDYTNAGLFWGPGSATNQQMRVRLNGFNADPQMRHANRAVDGSSYRTGRWTADAVPVGVWAPTLSGVGYEGNWFRNLVKPVHSDVSKVWTTGNVLFGQMTAFGGFDPVNPGIGAPPFLTGGWQFINEGADPRAATYGKMQATPTDLRVVRPPALPPVPTTLSDVIAIIRGAGLSN